MVVSVHSDPWLHFILKSEYLKINNNLIINNNQIKTVIIHTNKSNYDLKYFL